MYSMPIYTINTDNQFVFSPFLEKCSDLMCQIKASLFQICFIGTGNIHFAFRFFLNGCQLVYCIATTKHKLYIKWCCFSMEASMQDYSVVTYEFPNGKTMCRGNQPNLLPNLYERPPWWSSKYFNEKGLSFNIYMACHH